MLWLLCILALLLSALFVARQRRRPSNPSVRGVAVGVLHPNCLEGGGGERVLWIAVQAMLKDQGSTQVYLFGNIPESLPSNSLCALLHKQFGVTMSEDALGRLHLVSMPRASKWTDPSRYPRLTMLLQSAAGACWAVACLIASPVKLDIVLETTGDPLALPVARYLFGVRSAAYIHYPTISTDMLEDVRVQRQDTVSNTNSAIRRSSLLTAAKLRYYRILAVGYGWALSCADVLMVNSTWTQQHIQTIIGPRKSTPRIERVFPPCGKLDKLGRHDFPVGKRQAGLVLSLGQFRPEKNHTLQLCIMSSLTESAGARLVAVGGARHASDFARVKELQSRISEGNIPMHLQVNESRESITERWLCEAQVGLHTMRAEHFGISVVEMMSHGVIPVGHRSGGVCTDIVTDGENGFLAETPEEYTAILSRLLSDDFGDSGRERLREKGREDCKRFSDSAFRTGFMSALGL